MAFAAARMILKDKRRKSKEEFVTPARNRSKVSPSSSYPYFFFVSISLSYTYFVEYVLELIPNQIEWEFNRNSMHCQSIFYTQSKNMVWKPALCFVRRTFLRFQMKLEIQMQMYRSKFFPIQHWNICAYCTHIFILWKCWTIWEPAYAWTIIFQLENKIFLVCEQIEQWIGEYFCVLRKYVSSIGHITFMCGPLFGIFDNIFGVS